MRVEPDRSLIEFSAKHLGVATLRGRFSTADVKLDLNEEVMEELEPFADRVLPVLHTA